MITKSLAILGSTGSIGTQALEVSKHLGIKVDAISANSNIVLLEEQVRKFKPALCHVSDVNKGKELEIKLADTPTKVMYGADSLAPFVELSNADTLLTSVVGSVGLLPTIAGIDKGMKIALANKETLVTAGALVTERAKEKNVSIIPVDSEHSAIFQALQGNKSEQVKNIILTASGGPFFGKTRKELENVTVKDALKHPNWSMGAKITIDSATLMNKGLEVIESRWLFDTINIKVVVHRESVVHSMVEYADNSVIAQMGVPSMMLPIQYALTYPERLDGCAKALDFEKYSSLTFYKPDTDTFGLLKLGFLCMNEGESSTIAYNSANEVAVKYFLEEKIRFLDIEKVVKTVVENHRKCSIKSIDDCVAADLESRKKAEEMIGSMY